jgi:serine/threonine protein kinase
MSQEDPTEGIPPRRKDDTSGGTDSTMPGRAASASTGSQLYRLPHLGGIATRLPDVIAEKKTLEERLALLPHVLAVAEAIAYAHTERIIHRDLKPANVLVGPFGETVVIDWGLAKDLSREGDDTGGAPKLASQDSTLTLYGSVVGTPAYMPPEAGRRPARG